VTEFAVGRRNFIGLGVGATATIALGSLSACSSSAGGSGSVAKLVVANSTDPSPQLVMQANQTNYSWQRLVFNNLTTRGKSGAPTAQLAKSWEVSPYGLQVTLHLRDDVEFHDGRKFTGKDVAFALEYAKNPAAGCQLASIAGLVEKVQTAADSVELTLRQPTSQLFDLFEIMSIVDERSVSRLQGGDKVIGTGPFIWGNYKPGASVSFARNDKYWGGRPRLETVENAIITQSQALIAAARSNRAQITQGLTPLDLSTLSGSDFEAPVVGGIEAYLVGLDASKAPFDRLEVRQAIARSIDRDRIFKQVFQSQGSVSNLWWPDTTPGWSSETANRWSYDPAKARQDLASLGAAGLALPITVNAGDLVARAIFEVVRFNLAEAGLKPQPNILEATEFLDKNSKFALGPAFLHRTGFGSLSPATCATATPHIKPDGGTHFSTPEYVKLIAQAQKASADKVAAANAALGSYMVEQAFSLALIQRPPAIVTSKSLRNLETSSAFQYLELDKASLS